MLIVTVLVPSLKVPAPHPAYIAYIPYDTQYTCEHARDFEVDQAAFVQLADITDQTIMVRSVTAQCESAPPRI